MIIRKTPYILTAFLAFQLSAGFAANENTEVKDLSKEGAYGVVPVQLAPVTPFLATFEDFYAFTDGAPAVEINVNQLSPVPPREAEFEEITVSDPAAFVRDLAPVTPAVADFEDNV
jgi:hypothetical protein